MSGDNVDLSKLNELVTYADDKNVSLIGIINYEVAVLKGENSFFIDKPLGPDIVSPMASHLDHIENTEDYLKSNEIQYTKERVTRKKTRYSSHNNSSTTEEIYLGTRFTIKD